MLLEVCVDSLESATNAVYNGADELEVCSNLTCGGLTPSLEIVQQIIDMIDLYVTSQNKTLLKRPKVNVMIRCREGWDFCYNEKELDSMLQEIFQFKTLNIDRFVFGGLSITREVDSGTCLKIVGQAFPRPVTFHRAFDQTKDPMKSTEEIIRLGFTRVLTSGQRESAASVGAVKLIRKLINTFGNKIQIMPGVGITIDNVRIFKNIGCEIIHGTFKREKLTSSRDVKYVTDGELVQKVKEILNT